MKLLHIDSSVLGAQSVSRELSAATIARLSTQGDIDVTYRDLAAAPLSHLSGAYVAAMAAGAGNEHEPALAADLALGETVLEEFLVADIVVIGVALYNFTVPTQLKSWIDRLFVPGKTFRYTPKGPEGLAGDKRVILTIARGGFYGPGSPAAALEHAETYLRGVFRVFGVTRLEVIVAEGLRVGEDQRKAAISAASEKIAELT